MLFLDYEIDFAKNTEYLCPKCDPVEDKVAIEDLKSRIEEWNDDVKKLKEKVVGLKDTADFIIPYEKCHRYQRIQDKLKELKIRKNCYFQALNGKLITFK